MFRNIFVVTGLWASLASVAEPSSVWFSLEREIVAESEYDPTVNAARKELQAVEAELEQMKARLYPNVKLQAYAGQTGSRYFEAVTGFPDKYDDSSDNRLTISLSQPLFSQSARNQVAQGRAAVSQAGFRLEQEVLQFELRSIQMVAEYWRELANSRTQRSRWVEAQDKARIASTRQALGALSRTDNALTKGGEGLAASDLFASQNAVLRRLGAMPHLLSALQAVAPPANIPLKPIEVLDVWLKAGEDNALNVRIAEAAKEAAAAALAVAEADSLPTVDFTTRLAREKPSTAVSRSFYSESSTWSSGIEVNMPLYAGGSYRAGVARAASRYEKAAYELQAVRDKVRREIIEAYFDTATAMDKAQAIAGQLNALQVQERGLVASRLAGAALSADVLAIKSRMAQTRAEGMDAQLAAWFGLAKLFGAIGCSPRIMLDEAKASCTVLTGK